MEGYTKELWNLLLKVASVLQEKTTSVEHFDTNGEHMIELLSLIAVHVITNLMTPDNLVCFPISLRQILREFFFCTNIQPPIDHNKIIITYNPA